ncbi:hypothetical protein HPO_00505 [Hyphomonas polymorpha PS728]|uniref:Uncharacterized protein n=2 Tax=Hyphomonas polymorpha TaxID=74319 RepID=A0A062VQ86_9PROT|nr:hypothetical protein HPO_00505 [Hyphomonas polymorpha PS728]
MDPSDPPRPAATPEPEPVTAAPPPPPVAPVAPPEKRPLLKRLFGISLWGALKLLGLCILTGFFVMAANFDPGNPDFNLAEALRAILRQSFAALGWAITNFWQPALAGALVVLPVWVIWRVVSLPWRK